MNKTPDTTKIEEIVKSFEKEFPTLTTFEPYGAIPGGFEKDCKTEVLAWLTQTLKDYGDAIRGETEDDIFKTLKTDKELPNKLPHPIDAIKFRMEQSGLTQNDMTPYFGSKSKTSEVLNLKRELSKKMIRRLMAGLELSAEVLIQEYDLEQQ